jgi:hypothetical protein
VAKAKSAPVFLDTSIQVARMVHGPQTKARIRQRLEGYGQTVTGLVCRQEFKRRLIQEADYLLRFLQQYQSFDEVQHHLIRYPARWPKDLRKKNICLQMLTQVHGGTDEVRTERARLYLRSLLVAGLQRFDQSVEMVRQDSGCGCARAEVREKQPFRKYDLGVKHCSRLKAGECGVVAFLTRHASARAKVLEKLQAIPVEEKSAELKNAEAFLGQLANNPERAPAEDPCLKVGDLLIALESVGIEDFYTLNSAESQHLCRALAQTLIVCPIDPRQPEGVYDKNAKEWQLPRRGAASQGSKVEAEDDAGGT